MIKNKKTKNIIRQNKIPIIAIVLTLMVIIGGTYAWLTLTINGTKSNVLRAGTLQLTLDDTTSDGINLVNAVPMSDTKGLTTSAYTFTLKNNSSSSADYTIYLDDLNLDIAETRMADKYVKYSLVKNSGTATTALLTTIGTNPNRILDSGTISSNTTNTYSLRIWIDSSADNAVMKTVFSSKLRVDATPSIGDLVTNNKNIKAAYTYDDTTEATKCITGEESTCQKTTCYEDKTSETCVAGTIIKYAVNDSTEKYFYVLQDNGETLTLQQRENTINHVMWDTNESLDENGDLLINGPMVVLPQLESATSDWSNVENQTYTLGTTIFANNAYTGCGSGGGAFDVICEFNRYELPKRTSKARLISIQETTKLGCKSSSFSEDTNGSCPKWMYNYLNDSISNGGTVNDESISSNHENKGYWTVSVDDSSSAWVVKDLGYTDFANSNTDLLYGARAVVVVNK